MNTQYQTNKSSKECIIHIGGPKTGSTAIQKVLFNNFKGLHARGVHYFSNGSFNENFLFLLAFDSNPQRHFTVSRFNLSDEDIAKQKKDILEVLNAHFHRNRDKTFIISAEALHVLDRTGIKNLYNFVRQHRDLIKIVCYVRKPIAYMTSLFQQQIKSLMDISNPDELFQVPDYHQALIYKDIFHDCFVDIRVYDSTMLKESDIFIDFCHAINLDFPGEWSKRENEALSLEAIKLIYIYKTYLPKTQISMDDLLANDLLWTKLTELTGPKLHFNTYFLNRFDDKFKDCLSFAANNLQMDITEDYSTNEDDAISDLKELEDLARDTISYLFFKLDKPMNYNVNVLEIAELVGELEKKWYLEQQTANNRFSIKFKSLYHRIINKIRKF